MTPPKTPPKPLAEKELEEIEVLLNRADGISGCGNHGCVINNPRGMGGNLSCQCMGAHIRTPYGKEVFEALIIFKVLRKILGNAELKRLRAGSMSPREKRLREGLSQAKHTFNEIDTTDGDHSDLAEKGMEDAEKAKQEADLMRDGPSEEDRERIRRILLRPVLENSPHDLAWMAFKLSHEWGVE